MKIALTLSLFLVLIIAYPQPITNQIKLADGTIEGSTETPGVISFKGIPYAASPTGDWRWKAPQPVKPWTGVKKCVAFGASPVQQPPMPIYMWSEEFLIPSEPISEDCLFLNVWTSAKTNSDKLPVFVWIYGGAFQSGGTAVPVYDGTVSSSKGIVFVSINYRVGALGFLAHPDLTKEGNGHSGNYGLLDQIAALQWVKKNIQAFGGDPNNVTIGGQSAGSMAVVDLIASPLSKGLFSKAIAQSGATLLSQGPGQFSVKDLKDAEKDGIKYVEQLKVTTIAELRKKSSEELLEVPFRGLPIVDGYVFPSSISTIFKENKENNVVILTGWNEEEGMVMEQQTPEQFEKSVKDQYQSQADSFLKYYPASDVTHSQQALSRDQLFGAQNYALANITSSQGKKVYVYRFTHKVPGNGEYARFDAFHSGEIAYAYNTLSRSPRPWKPWDHELAEVMNSYWVNFIKKGDPNGSNLPTWPQYDVKSKKIILLGDKVVEGTIPDKERLDFMQATLSPK